MFSIERAWDTIIAVLLAAAGGFARLLNVKDSTKVQWSMIFSELFISAFSGLIICLIARASGLTGEWVGVAAGVSGWMEKESFPALLPF